tara:strand:+ start:112 stop:408 length:297 start_codon:yes stop_codon:yes gene_type:complete
VNKNNMKHLRAFEIKGLGATNHRGTRVKIMDLRATHTTSNNYKSVTLNWNYSLNTIEDQAQHYFNKIGIKINCAVWDSKNNKVFLMTDDFTTQLKKER